jgi:hypothetical protein
LTPNSADGNAGGAHEHEAKAADVPVQFGTATNHLHDHHFIVH